MVPQSELDNHKTLEDLKVQGVYNTQFNLSDDGELTSSVEVKEPQVTLSLRCVLEIIDNYRGQRRHRRTLEKMVRHLFTYEIDHLKPSQVPNDPAEALQWLWYTIEGRHHDPDPEILEHCKVTFERPMEIDLALWKGWKTMPAFFEEPYNDDLKNVFRSFAIHAVYAKLEAEKSAIKEALSRFPHSFFEKRDQARLELLERHREEILREIFAIIDQKIMEVNLYYRQFPEELPVIGSSKKKGGEGGI